MKIVELSPEELELVAGGGVIATDKPGDINSPPNS